MSRGVKRVKQAGGRTSVRVGRLAPLLPALSLLCWPLFGACAQQKAGEGLPPEAGTSAARVEPAPSSAASAEPQVKEPPALPKDFRVAMRIGDFKTAARVIDALPEAERQVPTTRYARAYAAAELGEHAACAEQLAALEETLTLLRTEITELRASCQLEAGPFDQAAAYYSAQGTSRDLLRAALAHERGGDAKSALAAAQQVISREATRRAQAKKRERDKLYPPSLRREAEARLIRARLKRAEGKEPEAQADLRWVATEVPELAPASGAGAPAAVKLSAKQRYERALRFADAGDVEATEAELELLKGASGPAILERELVHARAWSRYVARRYREAAPLLTKAAELGSVHAIRDAYYAARATSRAHDDARAIEMYEAFVKRHPGSSFAEHARYNAARLRYILGDWAGAELAYKAYLARHGARGQHSASARYELAVTWLAGGKPAQAEEALSALLADAKGRDEANLAQLIAVARLERGERAGAAKQLRGVIQEHPLSFAALAAAARLKQLGEAPPPPIALAAAPSSSAPLALSLPPKVRLLHEAGLALEAEAELGRQEASFRKAHGPRADEALCRAYEQLGSAERRYRVGQRAVSQQTLSRAPTEANRWSWECIYPEPFSAAVEREAEKNSLEPHLVYALIRQESAFRTTVVSPANAVGLMQLIPPTAKNVAQELDITYQPELLRVPAFNIQFGAYYLKKVLDQFSGSVPLALAAYNAGPSAVGRWLKTGHELPLDVFVARIPYAETRGYVGRVLGNLARYAYLKGGEAAVPELSLGLPGGVKVPDDAY